MMSYITSKNGCVNGRPWGIDICIAPSKKKKRPMGRVRASVSVSSQEFRPRKSS